jgi:hypothetical protein
MESKLREYDPSKVILIFAGIPLNQGIVKGTFITVARDERTWRHEKGVDGEATRVRTNNFAGRVEVSMQQAAAIQAALAAVLIVDELTGLGVGFMYLQDFSGRTLHASPRAYLEGQPDDAFGTDAGVRVWSIICDPLLMFSGGSQEVET